MNEAKEAMMVGEGFVVAPDYCGFLGNVRKSDTQYRAHFCKQYTELIQNDTELIDRNFFLFIKNFVDVGECFLDEGQVKFLPLLHLMHAKNYT